MKVSLPDKKTASGVKKKKDQKKRLGGISRPPHWSVLAFFGPVDLLQENTQNQNKCWMFYSSMKCSCVHDMKHEYCTYVSGEVPGLLGAGFAEEASLPDSTGH